MKRGIAMTLDQILQSIHDPHKRREGRARKRPIGMRADLLPALIRLIDRVEERHRVRHVDQDGQSQFTGSFPDWDQARIVHFDQLPLMVFDLQSKRLPDLQALRARFLLDTQPLAAQSGKASPMVSHFDQFTPPKIWNRSGAPSLKCFKCA